MASEQSLTRQQITLIEVLSEPNYPVTGAGKTTGSDLEIVRNSMVSPRIEGEIELWSTGPDTLEAWARRWNLLEAPDTPARWILEAIEARWEAQGTQDPAPSLWGTVEPLSLRMMALPWESPEGFEIRARAAFERELAAMRLRMEARDVQPGPARTGRPLEPARDAAWLVLKDCHGWTYPRIRQYFREHHTDTAVADEETIRRAVDRLRRAVGLLGQNREK